MGFEFIDTVITKMVQQYADVYNMRWDGHRVTPQNSYWRTFEQANWSQGAPASISNYLKDLKIKFKSDHKRFFFEDFIPQHIVQLTSNRSLRIEVPLSAYTSSSSPSISFSANLNFNLSISATNILDLGKPFQ